MASTQVVLAINSLVHTCHLHGGQWRNLSIKEAIQELQGLWTLSGYSKGYPLKSDVLGSRGTSGGKPGPQTGSEEKAESPTTFPFLTNSV
jgi:hypothetical protein